MSEPSCPGCQRLQRRVDELEELMRQALAEIARLKNNASNSSTPPSANPLDAVKPVVKKKSARKPGGQPDHPPNLKKLLPGDRVDHTIAIVPDRCEKCEQSLPAQAGPHDPEPRRHQVIELPKVLAVVTEYQAHGRTCSCCGHLTQETLPRELRAYWLGERLCAAIVNLTGGQGVSKRAVKVIAEELFGVPLGLGTITHIEQEMSEALASAHQEALAAVRQAEVKHADETSWKTTGKLTWLWGAATQSVAAFVISSSRGAAGLLALLGAEIQGILCSDRWHVYLQVPAERRQICWAHLKRDFQKVVDLGGPGAGVGVEGLKIVRKTFRLWHLFRGGGLTRAALQEKMAPVERRLNRVLVEGALGSDARVQKFCANVLELESALWNFIYLEDVEPTNNHMERLVRFAVLWRKRSFGCWSERGCRFVERTLSVVQTLRLQKRAVLNYLQTALAAHRAGRPIPELLL